MTIKNGPRPLSGFARDLSPEAQRRRGKLTVNDSARGRAGKAGSPWSRGPMCQTHNAFQTFEQYKRRGKA